ncbi:hypothetical protein AOLI_G00151750 [Acnodon oligacanthus]
MSQQSVEKAPVLLRATGSVPVKDRTQCRPESLLKPAERGARRSKMMDEWQKGQSSAEEERQKDKRWSGMRKGKVTDKTQVKGMRNRWGKGRAGKTEKISTLLKDGKEGGSKRIERKRVMARLSRRKAVVSERADLWIKRIEECDMIKSTGHSVAVERESRTRRLSSSLITRFTPPPP